MKFSFRESMCIVLGLLLPFSACGTKVKPSPLEVRVAEAEHIFVGVATNWTVLGENGRPVEPPSRNFQNLPCQMDVEVVEVLKSSVSLLPKYVKITYRNGWILSAKLQKAHFVGNRRVYLLTGKNFAPVDQYFFSEPIESKSDILRIIKPEPTPTPREAVIKKRAEELLAHLRAGRWLEALPYVAVVSEESYFKTNAHVCVNIATNEWMKQAALSQFKWLYENVRPGTNARVRVDERFTNTALVMYKHEDLDGFDMRYVGGEWYYLMHLKFPSTNATSQSTH